MVEHAKDHETSGQFSCENEEKAHQRNHNLEKVGLFGNSNPCELRELVNDLFAKFVSSKVRKRSRF